LKNSMMLCIDAPPYLIQTQIQIRGPGPPLSAMIAFLTFVGLLLSKTAWSAGERPESLITFTRFLIQSARRLWSNDNVRMKFPSGQRSPAVETLRGTWLLNSTPFAAEPRL